MSVARIGEIAKRFAAVSGKQVHYQPGWEWRGNGQTSAYEGIVNHHTATGYANQNLGVLINGRPDLDGPLCNFCTWANGDIGVIAAHPANHAGASGGYNTAPLPNTGAFNKFVIGNEIIYPGNSPMTPEQYNSSVILSRIAVDVVGWGDPARVKGHAETSVTGKWDPGYAPGKTIDLGAFRTAVRNVKVSPTVEALMSNLTPVSLPFSNVDEFCVFPFEGDANSGIIKKGWFALVAGWGTVEYEVLCLGPNLTLMGPAWSSLPTKGTLKDRQRAFWVLPDNIEGVALRYKCLNSTARLGYAFPQINK